MKALNIQIEDNQHEWIREAFDAGFMADIVREAISTAWSRRAR